MRRKKHKASRRAVKYYKIHFGFREPFKVLLDGNFLHAVCQLKYENIEGIISTLLGGRVTLFVPSCAMRELRQLAKDDPELRAAATLARSFMRHKDNCPPSESSTDCLLKQVGNSNSQHWWLATQDRTIINCLRKKPGCGTPLISADLNGIHLLPPSDEVKTATSQQTQEKMKLEATAPEADADVGDGEGAMSSGAMKKTKRPKKAAAPNPLAVRQKARVVAAAAAGGGVAKKTRRKRNGAAQQAVGD